MIQTKYIKILVLLFSILNLCEATVFAQDKPLRTTNFPKLVEVVEEMPNPENLWVFFMAGQSNMAGRGFVEPQDTISNKRILTINKNNQWIYAKEPLDLYDPSKRGLDCGMSFAKTLLKKVPKGVSIAIIPCAVGGSKVEQWLNDDFFRGINLFTNFKSKVEFANKIGTIKGILWHQGESNANPKLIPSYQANLEKLIGRFRGVIGNNKLPIFLGQLGYFSDAKGRKGNWDKMNIIIENVAKNNNHNFLIETQDLKDRGDKLHFNTEGQRRLGERYANKFIESFKASN